MRRRAHSGNDLRLVSFIAAVVDSSETKSSMYIMYTCNGGLYYLHTSEEQISVRDLYLVSFIAGVVENQ